MVPEICDNRFVYGGQIQRNAKMHVQDFADNAADVQHFLPLHSHLMGPVGIRHKVKWERHPDHSHIMFFLNDACLTLVGYPLELTGSFAYVTFVGPSVVMFRFFTQTGQVLVIKSFLPLKPLEQQVKDVWFCEPKVPRTLAKYFVDNFVRAVDEDRVVWENKIWCRQPVLVPNDGPINKCRAWFKQFYSTNSRKVASEPAGCGGQPTSIDW